MEERRQSERRISGRHVRPNLALLEVNIGDDGDDDDDDVDG